MKKLALFFAMTAALILVPVKSIANGETASPYMGLPVPAVGVTIGPDWASDINVSLGLIDAHDHSPGNGVQVTPSGLDISSDLTFAGNNATNLRSTRFSAQSSPISNAADVGALYVSGVDLYYNDGSGNQIRITQSGNVAGSSGTITGLPSGTASAAYASGSGTFVFQQATSTAANMDIGTLIIRYPGSYPSPAGNYIAFQAPTTLATGYALTFPATLPATSGAFLTFSTAGAGSYTNVDNSSLQIASSVLGVKANGIQGSMLNSNVVDNVTLQYSSSQLSIKALGVDTAQIAAGAVTLPKIAAATLNSATIDNIFSPSTTTTAGTAAITTVGRAVLIILQANSASDGASYLASSGSVSYIRFARNGTVLGTFPIDAALTTAHLPVNLSMIDTGASSGSNSYTCVMVAGDGGAVIANSKFLVKELP